MSPPQLFPSVADLSESSTPSTLGNAKVIAQNRVGQ